MEPVDRRSIIILINERSPKLRKSFFYSGMMFLNNNIPAFSLFEDLLEANSSTTDNSYTIHTGCREFTTITVTTIENMPNPWKKSDRVAFIAGNPLNEQSEGIIHMFAKPIKSSHKNTVQSEMLCILGIPCSVTVKDLLDFISPMSGNIIELKVVKSNRVGHYMALLMFKTPEATDQFYEAFNGCKYNSFESDTCQLCYVSHVEAITTSPNGSFGASFPLKGRIELPSCPVCLEKLDEPVAGILTTILCNHSFHGQCISKTTDTVCPVCRYVQSPEMQEESKCADCDLRENLWICLICGNLGCGRYGHKHAYAHFENTGHTFALEVTTNLVWDYADDAYVHRIAVNLEDGKLVQVGEGGETGDKKTDNLCMEFSALLVSQLDSQRQYFEGQLKAVSEQSAERISIIEADLEKTNRTLTDLETRLATVTKEKNALSQKFATSNSLAQRLHKELSEERALIAGLSSSASTWEERAKKAEKELAAAREELVDLLLNLELRDKIAEASAANNVGFPSLVSPLQCPPYLASLQSLGATAVITSGELEESELTVKEPTQRPRRRRKNR
ncbi:unnamed protein product [Rodentolepis nana]|uniref:BRCA1-associated protein n=1 Tax=Rodentolepis nana TaxID=102285 RepID=A0A0R3TLH6_RODNA|nr:unnamed protein product [Rodentolepis nana]